MCIDKDENALVIIKKNNHFYWFASFKEMWVLDRIKWFDDFLSNGIDNFDPTDHRERYNIAIVDQLNCDDFISFLKRDGYEVNRNDLSEQFYKMDLSEKKWWDVYNFFPDIFINFDNKELFSQYVENMHYEKYVPDGWIGELNDFCKGNIIPRSEVFWIRDGLDYREYILEKG